MPLFQGMDSHILLVPISTVDANLIASLVASLRRDLGIPVSVEEKQTIDPSSAFDAYRNQYNSTVLISALQNRFTRRAGKILGVTGIDLFVPVLTFVFGEAQLDGQVAVVSSHRLEDSFYGLASDRELTEKRLLKESIHELGHAFGLVHCSDYLCVMHSSTGVDEIDVKTEHFCVSCRLQLSAAINR
jgi:archaemetzincin